MLVLPSQDRHLIAQPDLGDLDPVGRHLLTAQDDGGARATGDPPRERVRQVDAPGDQLLRCQQVLEVRDSQFAWPSRGQSDLDVPADGVQRGSTTLVRPWEAQGERERPPLAQAASPRERKPNLRRGSSLVVRLRDCAIPGGEELLDGLDQGATERLLLPQGGEMSG